MNHPHDEYYLAVSQHTAILADLTQARTQLALIEGQGQATPRTIMKLQSKIKLLLRLAIASQKAVALKEEALGKEVE